MQGRIPSATILIAIAALSTGATGQNAYKCGDTYSQLPCPGATIIDAADQRSNAQKVHSDLATARAARTAQAMQQARLQQEKKDLATNTPAVTPASSRQASAVRTSQAKLKKRAPEFFTAQIPEEKKKKQAATKSADKKAQSKS